MVKKNKTGFTLIEFSMVVLVIAFLVGMAILGGRKLFHNARITAAQALTASSPVKDIPNLALWLESTSKNSFIKSEIISSTQNISTWYDINKQSQFQSNATQATTSLQPTYQANIINGLPAIFFGSTSASGMLISSTLNITGNYSIFIVLKTGNSTSGRSLQSQSINWLLGTHSTPCICYYDGTGWVSNSVVQVAGTVYLAEAVRNTVSAFYINGVNDTTTGVPDAAPGTLALSAAGANNEPMNGYIGEVIVFARDLITAERQDVESYLMQKWNIP